MKKTLIYLLCFVLIITMFLGGCTKTEDPASKPNDSESQNVKKDDEGKDKEGEDSKDDEDEGGEDVGGLKLPIVEPGTVTLTWGGPDNGYAPASYTQNLAIFEEIEKKTGVKIEWDVVPSAQYGTTMQTRLAAGTDLPDMISVPGDPVKYASDGLIIPIDELIGEHAPNITKYFEADPVVKKVSVAPDGHIYTISSVTTGTSVSDPYAWIVRRDWLERLNLKEPETIDDWYEMLSAFKKGDANGNGDTDDEIPLVGRYGVRDLTRFGESWGLHLFYSQGFWPNDSGEVEYEWLKPEAKELIVWLNKLFSEGLIDEEFLTTDGDGRMSKISRNIIGASTHFINAIDNWDKTLEKAGVTDVDHIAVVPPVGPNGYKGHIEAYGPISGYVAITNSCENPEVAIKWLDYVYASEEGNLYTCFGIEGKSYVMEDGEPKYTEWATDNPDDLPLASALRSLGAMPTGIPWIRSTEAPWDKQNMAFIAHLPKTVEMAEKMQPYIIPAYPPILATEEEAQELGSLMTDLETYREEMLAKFIMGQESMDKWDDFTAKLEGMVSDVLKIKQQQYDRFSSAE